MLDAEGSRIEIADSVIVAGTRHHGRPGCPMRTLRSWSKVFSPDHIEAASEAISRVEFAAAAFGVHTRRDDRISRYEQSADVRVAEFTAHFGDEVVG